MQISWNMNMKNSPVMTVSLKERKMVKFNYITVNSNFLHNKLLPSVNRPWGIAQNLLNQMLVYQKRHIWHSFYNEKVP